MRKLTLTFTLIKNKEAINMNDIKSKLINFMYIFVVAGLCLVGSKQVSAITPQVAAALILQAEAGLIEPIEDHVMCYEITDSEEFLGSFDIVTPQFGLESNCKIKKAKYFCAPAKKENIVDEEGNPVALLEIYDVNFNDRICYEVDCMDNLFPEELEVEDQFGMRIVSKKAPKITKKGNIVGAPRFEASPLLCTPAVKSM